MALEDNLLQNLRRLPPERQQEVLDFAEFLVSRRPAAKSPSAWPVGFFEEVLGGWEGDPLERPAQGDFETRLDL